MRLGGGEAFLLGLFCHMHSSIKLGAEEVRAGEWVGCCLAPCFSWPIRPRPRQHRVPHNQMARKKSALCAGVRIAMSWHLSNVIHMGRKLPKYTE